MTKARVAQRKERVEIIPQPPAIYVGDLYDAMLKDGMITLDQHKQALNALERHTKRLTYQRNYMRDYRKKLKAKKAET